MLGNIVQMIDHTVSVHGQNVQGQCYFYGPLEKNIRYGLWEFRKVALSMPKYLSLGAR